VKFTQFLKQAVVISGEIRPRLRKGADMPWRFSVEKRFGSTYYRLLANKIDIQVDGQSAGEGMPLIALLSDRPTAALSAKLGTIPADSQALGRLGIGPHKVKLTAEIAIVYGTVQGLPNPREPLPKTLATKSWESELPFELVEGPTVKAVENPELATKLRQALSVRLLSRRGLLDTADTMIGCEIDPPVALAFDMFIRDAGQEKRIGVYAFRSQQTGNVVTRDRITLAAGHTVDVVLRSSAAVAESQIGIEEYWVGEIVIPGIFVSGWSGMP
jgi:hypothetical protein